MKKAKIKDPNQISLFDSPVDELSEIGEKSHQMKNNEWIVGKKSSMPIKANLYINEICKGKGILNLDKADFNTVLNGAELIYIGAGHAAGDGKEKKAARAAIENPMMEMPFNEALKVLVINTVSLDIEPEEIEVAAEVIEKAAHPDANIFFGAFFCEEMDDEIRIDIIASR